MARSSGRGHNVRSVSRPGARAPIGGGLKTKSYSPVSPIGLYAKAGKNRVGRPGGANVFAPNAGSQAAQVKGPRGATRVGGVKIASLNAEGPIGRGGVGLPRKANTGIASRRARAAQR